ncbi:molybdenum cofactor guanylyltransferase [uncultured Kocuria sp.]|uniref:molybdenum cofactor guanylyltransferase n=1 Tax=uncultured Kocuria sp. TaxID=259305 RepID=UPI00259678DE|nr:NTP transferase domain-containing protein [uncultured Kocuria sp.]MCT1367346.1 NTP transferase domain-containing protein [Rothia sp. p3-SID1597]
MIHREYFALILAGGRSSRLHHTAPAPTPDKPLLRDSSGTLLEHSLRELSRWADVPSQRCVIVGPQDLPVPAGATVTREDPPFSGPAAAIHAGLVAVGRLLSPQDDAESRSEPWVYLTAADMPQSGPGFTALRKAVESTEATVDAAVGIDDHHWQPLLSLVRWSAALQAFGPDSAGASIRSRLSKLNLVEAPIPHAAGADVDTWEDAVTLGFTSVAGGEDS